MSFTNFPETEQYHTARLAKDQDAARTRLADHLARHRFGKGLDHDTPVGNKMLAFARDLLMDDADALLSCPGITVTSEATA